MTSGNGRPGRVRESYSIPAYACIGGTEKPSLTLPDPVLDPVLSHRIDYWVWVDLPPKTFDPLAFRTSRCRSLEVSER